MREQRQCIYCRGQLETRPPAEHVLPQLFGTFEKNLTIFCVCGSCNNAFSKLELFLGRDSAEAIQRLRFGLKPTSAAREIRGRRLTMRVSEPGSWCGAYAVLDGDENSVFPTFLPQAAFQASADAPWEWVLERDFGRETTSKYPPASAQVRVAGGSDEELNHVVDSLECLGYAFPSREVRDVPTGADEGSFHINVEAMIDEAIFRAIAKVAFNYFTFANGPSVALRAEFDPIRSFVHNGTPPGWPVVQPSDQPILENERAGQRVTDGHILTVGWNAEGTAPQSKIAFFNATTYIVRLCAKLSAPLQLQGSGHHMHPELRLIERLSTLPRILIGD